MANTHHTTADLQKWRLTTGSSAWSVSPPDLLVRNASDPVHVLAKSRKDNPSVTTSFSCTKLSDANWQDGTEDVVEGVVVDLSPSHIAAPTASLHFSRHTPQRQEAFGVAGSIGSDADSHSLTDSRPRTTSRRRALFDQVASKVTSPIRETSRKAFGHASKHEKVPQAATSRPSSVRSATMQSPIKSPFNSPPPPTLYEHKALSPVLARSTSPVAFPPLAESLGELPSPLTWRLQRSHTSAAEGTSHRASRRSSVLSGGSSINSPASMFLSQWSRTSEESAQQPDDEGQEFGDRGEFVMGRLIGYGGFSVVKEAHTIEGDKKVSRAVKIVRKQTEGKDSNENEKLQQEFEHEVSIWRHLHHPNILPLLSVYDTDFATFCVTELNTGGTLSDLIREHRRSSIRSKQSDSVGSQASIGRADIKSSRLIGLQLAKQCIRQLASAVRYLHQDARLVHRDIKLENCLIDNVSSDGTRSRDARVILRLCDFGMSDYILREARDNSHQGEQQWSDGSLSSDSDSESPCIGSSSTSTCIAGSLPYASPEMLCARQPLYETSSDMWAFGVVCFALLTSEMPFSHSFAPKLQMLIARGQWDSEIVLKALRAVGASDEEVEAALALLSGCLSVGVDKRWSIDQVLVNKFLQEPMWC